MTDDRGRDRPTRADVRMRGFADRASLERATRWIDAHARILADEDIDAARGAGRVLAVDLTTPRDLPSEDRASEDGYAVRACETIGAGDYSPLPFALGSPDGALPRGAAVPIVSGAAMPAGSDAIVPFEAAQPNGNAVDIFVPVAPGRGVERRARQAAAGTVLIERGRRLRVQDLGLLASLGLGRIRAIRQPRITLISAGPKSRGACALQDADEPMLRELVRRDGGMVVHVALQAATRAAMVEAMTTRASDAILVAGRTGTGADDEAPMALAEAGELAIHGLALRPGESAGMGLVRGTPVVLLPGDPLACLCAYEMIAARLVRSLRGLDPTTRDRSRVVEVGRKIVSAVGLVDICQVRLVGNRAEPVGSAELGGLLPAVRADGFVVVPAPMEGYAPGTRVVMYAYGEAGAVRPEDEESEN
jgi:molybdopterin molybdotransferase